MRSIPPKASEDAKSVQSDEAHSHLINVSPVDKRDGLVSDTGSEAALAIKVPSAANIESNGTQHESNSNNKPTEDYVRPVKRQKQEDLPMDNSPDVPVSSIASKLPDNVAAQGNTDSGSALSTPANDIVDYSSIIHPSVAEIINLEFIPEVEPLECLSIREMAGKFGYC